VKHVIKDVWNFSFFLIFFIVFCSMVCFYQLHNFFTEFHVCQIVQGLRWPCEISHNVQVGEEERDGKRGTSDSGEFRGPVERFIGCLIISLVFRNRFYSFFCTTVFIIIQMVYFSFCKICTEFIEMMVRESFLSLILVQGMTIV
jgi:hypothetical protein